MRVLGVWFKSWIGVLKVEALWFRVQILRVEGWGGSGFGVSL